jgi:hypothetical protein
MIAISETHAGKGHTDGGQGTPLCDDIAEHPMPRPGVLDGAAPSEAFVAAVRQTVET